jgi:drug/metabolite transporter (DMT)-like permease
MLIGGGVMLLTGFLVGEWNQWDIQKTSTSSILSWLYLVVAGSLIAYSAFAWLTQNAPPVLVSTYAYINPAVAVFLGWAILNEEIYRQTLVSSIVIVIGVALISISKKRQTK